MSVHLSVYKYQDICIRLFLYYICPSVCLALRICQVTCLRRLQTGKGETIVYKAFVLKSWFKENSVLMRVSRDYNNATKSNVAAKKEQDFCNVAHEVILR